MPFSDAAIPYLLLVPAVIALLAALLVTFYVALGPPFRPFFRPRDAATLALPILIALALREALLFHAYKSETREAAERFHESFVELRADNQEYWVGPGGSSMIRRWRAADIPSRCGPAEVAAAAIFSPIWLIARRLSRRQSPTPPPLTAPPRGGE